MNRLIAGTRGRLEPGAKVSTSGITPAERWRTGVMLEASCVDWDAGLTLDPVPDTAEIFGTSPSGLA